MQRLLATLALVSLLAACGSPCQDLGDRICLCQPPGGVRDACKQSISEQISKGNPKPGSSQQDFCDAKLKTCPDPSSNSTACEQMATEAGKVACGLAYDASGT